MAELISEDRDQLVHNHQLKEGYGYFLIKNVYLKSAIKFWYGFDPEKHMTGTYIQWNMENATERMLPKPSSEALDTSGPKEVERGRGRWKKSDESQWKINQRQLKRRRGESYSPASKKGSDPKPRKKAREMQAKCNCRLKCGELISDEDRKRVFDKYWQLADTEKQAQYIVNNMAKEEAARSRRRPETKTGKRRNRQMSTTYYLKGVRVCKVMFHNTLNVSETHVKTCWAKSNEGIAFPDHGLKGKASNHKLTKEQEESIFKHIKSFPVMESHYLRQQTERQYLDSNLNIEKMYDLYKEKNSNAAFDLPSSQSYRRIFCESFNLGFHKPKKDQCTLCNAYKDADGAEKLALKNEYDQHLQDRKIAQDLKKTMKEEASAMDGKVVLCFDLQKVLPTPFGEDGDFYYVSKLSTYNLTVYNLTEKQGYCYMWDETVSRRGANEIASCLFEHLLSSEIRVNTDLHLFADSCPGQTRNRWIMKMMSIVLKKIPNIQSIDLVFLVKGHTHNENDSVHAAIERAKKGVTIHHPGEWITLAERACKVRPYPVQWMEKEKFFNFKDDFDGLYVIMNKDAPLDTEYKKKVRLS